MKIKYIIAFVFYFTGCFFLSAQSSPFSFSTGITFSQRSFSSDENYMTLQEVYSANELEILKPSYSISISYSFAGSYYDKGLVAGLTHKWLRLGTRRFDIPDSVRTVTPQYSVYKEIVRQKQLSLYLKYQYPILISLNHFAIFCRTDFVYNYDNYIILKTPFDQNGDSKSRMKVFGANTFFEKFDMALSIGSNIKIYNTRRGSFYLEAYLGRYIRPYTIYGRGIGGYLVFNKDTVGNIWNGGFRISYRPKRKYKVIEY